MNPFRPELALSSQKGGGRLPPLKGEIVMRTLLKQNEGTADRVLRVALGATLIALVFVGPQTPLGWIGVIPLATGLLGTCPIYSLLGVSTCPTKAS